VPVSSEVTNLTSFANEACDQVDIRSGFMPLPEHYIDEKTVMDIREYFSRPRLIDTVTYNQTSRGVMSSYDMTNALLNSNLTNFERVFGAFGWRGTVCYRIQAISNPFQAGRVRLALDPCWGDQTAWSRGEAITPISQLPGVEMDICESTSAILKVPFIHPLNYFTVSTTAGAGGTDIGLVTLFAMTPIALGSGGIAPSIAVWRWVEDFELIGACPGNLNVQPQAGKFQSNKRDTAAMEQDAIPGNLSNVLAAGAKFATWLGTKVPLISSYSGTTSWMLRETARVAASLGWSKPLITTPLNKMLNTYNTYQFNSDGSDGGNGVGMFADNAVAPLSGFAGTDVDEMSFDYVKSTYAVIAQPSFSTTDITSSYIYQCALRPRDLYFQPGSDNFGFTVTSGQSFWPSPVCALQNVFEKYRGGLKFRVKISKTKFHTGRLVLGYIPNYPNNVNKPLVPANPLDMQYKSVVWDLREGNIMEFECPFLSPFGYLDADYFYGNFFICVIEPLAGPPTVAQTVPFIVEVAGMPDLEFAVPSTAINPIANLNPDFFAQAGPFEPYAVEKDTTVSMYAIGEKINSVKQMISRACLDYTQTGSGQYQPSIALNYPSLVPATGTPKTGITGIDSSYINYFSGWYRFARGGFMIDAIPIGNDIALTATRFNPNDNTAVPIITEGRTALHIKYPYYNNFSRNLVAAQTPFGFSETSNLLFSVSSGTTEASTLIYKRAADDFQLGYFVGAPPLLKPFSPLGEVWSNARNALSTDH
jgi:hypothetical protein